MPVSKGLIRLVWLLFVRDSQLKPALGSAAFQNKLPAFGLHTGPETKFPVPFNLAGLISPFHGIYSCI